LLNIAKLAGFTQESFNACLKNQEVMNTVLAVRNKASDDYGVSGTPTFFIDGKKHVGNATFEELSKLIEDAM
jgi:protein-disulfide isomerase